MLHGLLPDYNHITIMQKHKQIMLNTVYINEAHKKTSNDLVGNPKEPSSIA